MHKTIYIDVVDEITGIIDRIRSEGATDIFLVVPKNAMLVQGMLNLKLLKKEASRLGKNVMLVTNDKFVKKVIERSGLETVDRPVENDHQQTASGLGSSILNHNKIETLEQKATEESIHELEKTGFGEKKSSQIGSPSFFDSSSSVAGKEKFFPSSKDSESEKLRKELYMKKARQQDLNRAGFVEPGRQFGNKAVSSFDAGQQAYANKGPAADRNHYVPAYEQNSRESRRLDVSDAGENNHTLFGPGRETENPVKISQGIDLRHGWNNRKAEDFFANEFQHPAVKKREDEEEKSRGGIFKTLAVLATVILFLAVLAAYVWWNYPNAEISLSAERQLENINLDIVASADTEYPDFENMAIPAILQEVEIEKTIRQETTEEKFVSDDGKAKGKVVISNKYSSSPQPLVATTRVLSKEGKLFRLVQGATVPGMNGEEPGQIEVSVIADKPGKDFNIESSSFTIEGFKGSPKYEKFEVVSKNPMSGGSDESGNKKAKVVTASDLESARQKALEELDKDMEKLILEKVGQESKVLADIAKKEIISNSSSLSDGDTGDSLDYSIKEKIQVLVFDEEDVRQLLVRELEKKLPGGYNIKDVSRIDYAKAVPDYDKKKLNLKASAVGTLVAKLDVENIKKGIAGKNENGIKQFLENYSELEKAQIKITPAWLGSLSVSQRKIEIQIIEN